MLFVDQGTPVPCCSPNRMVVGSPSIRFTCQRMLRDDIIVNIDVVIFSHSSGNVAEIHGYLFPMASPSRLSPQQANALFNILSHHETYTEIESFKYSKAIAEYGPPFQAGPDTKSGSPILQTLLTHLLLPLPGLKDVSPSFWPERVLPFISALSSANLSESYDKGILGQRKTLATAISAILECPARGYFGGLAKQKLQKESGNYNTSSPEDGADAWHDLLQQVVYGNAIDEIFTRATETENLQEHSSLVQTAHKFIVLK